MLDGEVKKPMPQNVKVKRADIRKKEENAKAHLPQTPAGAT